MPILFVLVYIFREGGYLNFFDNSTGVNVKAYMHFARAEFVLLAAATPLVNEL